VWCIGYNSCTVKKIGYTAFLKVGRLEMLFYNILSWLVGEGHGGVIVTVSQVSARVEEI
jgi:hypothetical protein